jgi:hypothetical protein
VAAGIKASDSPVASPEEGHPALIRIITKPLYRDEPESLSFKTKASPPW